MGASGLAEVAVAVAHGIEIEVAYPVQVMPPRDVASDTPDDPLVGVGIDEQLQVHQSAEGGVVQHQDALHDDHVGVAFAGGVEVAAKAGEVERVRMVVVRPGSTSAGRRVLGEMVPRQEVAILVYEAHAQRLEQAPELLCRGGLAGGAPASDPYDESGHAGTPHCPV